MAGALLFEGPLALRMPRDKKEAVHSEGNVKGVDYPWNSRSRTRHGSDILSRNRCGSEIARWAPESRETEKKSVLRYGRVYRSGVTV